MRGIDLLEDIGYIEDCLVQEAAIHERVKASAKIHNWSKWTRWGSVAAGFAVLCIAAVVLRQNFGSNDATESATATDKAAIYTVEDSVAEYAAEEVMEQNADKKAEAADEVGVGASDSTSTTDTSASASTTTVTEAKYDVVTEETELRIVKEYSMEKEVDGEIANLEAVVCYAAPEKGEYFYLYELEEAMKAYAGQAVQYYVAIDVFGDNTDENGEASYGQLTLEVIYGGDEVYDKNSPVIKEYERLLAEGYKVIIEEEELRGYFTEEELNTFAVNPEYGYTFRFTEDF